MEVVGGKISLQKSVVGSVDLPFWVSVVMVVVETRKK